MEEGDAPSRWKIYGLHLTLRGLDLNHEDDAACTDLQEHSSVHWPFFAHRAAHDTLTL